MSGKAEKLEKLLSDIRQSLEAMSDEELQRVEKLSLTATNKGAEEASDISTCWQITSPCSLVH